MRGEGQTRPNPFAAALACILAVLVTGFASRDKASSSPSAATQSDGDIVFSVFEDMPAANCGGLFAVDPGTRKVQALAGFGPSGPLLQPAFSPDGRTLTVTALNGSSSRDETVFRYEQESGKVVRHASKSSLPSVPPVWSRQSDAFLVLRRGSLHAVDLARHDHELLRGSASPALGYSWSPDEKKIAYTRSPVRRPSAIWIVGRDGANPRLFIRGANDPAWLLDGSRMIVWANAELQSPALVKVVEVASRKTRVLPGGPFVHSTFAVRAVDPRGRRIFLLKPPRAGSKSDYEDGDLVVQAINATTPGRVIARNVIPVQWSPSGRRLLILRPREVTGETVFVVAVIDPNGRNERAVAVIDEQDINGVLSYPAWQPGLRQITKVVGDYAPQPRVAACAPRIARLRDRLAPR